MSSNWVLVPRELTLEMCCALCGGFDANDSPDEIFASVIALAPDPVEDEGLVEEVARVLAHRAADDCVPGIAAAEYEDSNWREWEDYARAILAHLGGK